MYLGLGSGAMVQWDIDEEELLEGKEWKFPHGILSIAISQDNNYMAVCTHSGLYLLTRNPPRFVHSWLMLALVLLLLVAVSIAFGFSLRKGRSLVVETDQLKKSITRSRLRNPTVSIFSEEEPLQSDKVQPKNAEGAPS